MWVLTVRPGILELRDGTSVPTSACVWKKDITLSSQITVSNARANIRRNGIENVMQSVICHDVYIARRL